MRIWGDTSQKLSIGHNANFERCRTLRKICFYREQENFFAIHSSPKYKMLDKYFVEKEHKMRMHGVFQF